MITGTYTCRHCANQHPKITGDTTVTCRCGTGRPHLACPRPCWVCDRPIHRETDHRYITEAQAMEWFGQQPEGNSGPATIDGVTYTYAS